jgi:cell division protein FtsW (lipid II flippase)
MKRDAQGRKQVDLFALPLWAQRAIALATVAVVVGLALIFAQPTSGPTVPVSAVVAAVIAFAILAWRAQHR